ncbi:MAG: hypothetical protein EOP86_05165 [Verrucomicrobiaceae bacterium]|nr:MAG: hypothetical protein EOP86_05165 [Verrucomicrobiaceae bacterium]
MTDASAQTNWLHHGQAVPAESPAALSAGPLRVDLVEGELRYFTVEGTEALRRIYAAVRDGSWNTVPAKRSGLEVERGEDSFTVKWRSEHVDGDIDFVWDSRITGTPDGCIRWEFDGTARSAFAKNRVGFCILHPLETCMGQPCEVEHVSGDIADRTFPTLIDPYQPVRGLHDYRRLKHAAGAWDVELEWEGDAFEMEDQRNWTDASFKTYSTPQRIPLPARLRAGQRVRQVVTIRVTPRSGEGEKAKAATPRAVPTVDENAALPFPKIGLGMATHGGMMSEHEITLLKGLSLSHLRVDVKTSQPEWPATLAQAGREAVRLDCGLEIALHLTHADALAAVVAAAAELPCPIARWLVLEEGKPVVNPGLLKAARAVLPGPVGAGTDIDFFPLNNNRPAAHSADFIFCSLRPQAHAFDDATIIENLVGQEHVVTTSRRIFDPLPFVASPVTLRRRWHKGAPRPAGELPPMVDPRQLSLLGAGWLTGSLRALAQSGAVSITWFETTGWRGVMETEQGSPLPDQFPSEPGAVFPMYHVLLAAARFQEGEILPVSLPNPLEVQAVVLRHQNHRRWILSNVSALPRTVELPGISETGATVTVRRLNAESAPAAAQVPTAFLTDADPLPYGPLTLAPYETAFVDVIHS